MSVVFSLRDPGDTEFAGRSFALWYPSADDPEFEPSRSRQCVTRWYEKAEGIHTYLFGAVLGQIWREDNAGRFALPSDDVYIPALGPEGERVLVSASDERGLHFLLDTALSAEEREAVLVAMLYLAEMMDLRVRRYDLPRDADAAAPARWWRGAEARAIAAEQGGSPGPVALMRWDG